MPAKLPCHPKEVIFNGAMVSSPPRDFPQVQSLTAARPWIETFCRGMAPASVLLAVDVDMTILKPAAAEFRQCNFIKHATLFREFFAELTPLQRDYVQNLALLQTPPQLTEAVAVAFVNDYRNRGFQAIALTAILSGKVGNQERMECWRADTLQTLGFHFSEKFQNRSEILLRDMPHYRGYFPLFYRGVLVSNGEGGPTHKGDALLSWLRCSGGVPQRIICIDDRRQNLEDLSQSLGNHRPEIPFLGIEYGGCLMEKVPTHEANIRSFWEPLIRRTRQEIKTD